MKEKKGKSKTYGTYNLTKIAKIRFIPLIDENASEDERWQRLWAISEWMEKFHPTKYFESYSIETTRPDLPKHIELGLGGESQEHHPYILYLPLRKDNERWYYENKDSDYAQYIYKNKLSSRALPIAVTPYKLNIWLTKAEEIGIIIEKYYNDL